MDLSKLKWLKNVKTVELGEHWAYDKPDKIPIIEARIFCLHWRSQDDETNAQQPLKGELVALVQLAKVTHIVELIDDVVYRMDLTSLTRWFRVLTALYSSPYELFKQPH
jgi:hypothetical protein